MCNTGNIKWMSQYLPQLCEQDTGNIKWKSQYLTQQSEQPNIQYQYRLYENQLTFWMFYLVIVITYEFEMITSYGWHNLQNIENPRQDWLVQAFVIYEKNPLRKHIIIPKLKQKHKSNSECLDLIIKF